MADTPAMQPEKLSWRFPRTFWFANGAELCERAAYYGMFITLFRFLTQNVGFTDVQAGVITATFSSLLYFFPTLMGIVADKIGFKQALLLAFAILTGGYALLGAVQVKGAAIIALTLIMLGGAIVKPVISGTVAKCSDGVNRARAMSIFYMVVNIGSFSGKGLAGELNNALGLQYINFYSAGMAFAALLLVAVFYRNPDVEGVGKTVGEALRGLGRVLLNFRFDALIIIIGGFWAIQGQLYGAMPSYIERLLGPQYRPEWLANINPLVVVLCVVPITHLVRNFRPSNAIGIALLIIPFTALLVALTPVLASITGGRVNLGIVQLPPMIAMFIVGIALQGLAECFLSPKWLEFASKQAPKNEVGLYLGYSHLTTCVSWAFTFILAGFLLEAYCPDPRTLTPEVREQWRAAIDPHFVTDLNTGAVEGLPRDAQSGESVPMPEDLRAALAAQSVAVGPDAVLHRAALTEGPWVKDTQAAWSFAADGHEYTIAVVEFKIEPRDEHHTWLSRIRGFFVTTEQTTVTEVLLLDSQPRANAATTKFPEQYRRAHYIWYVFTAVGVVAFLAMLIFNFVTGAIDRRRAADSAGT